MDDEVEPEFQNSKQNAIDLQMIPIWQWWTSELRAVKEEKGRVHVIFITLQSTHVAR